MAKKKISQIGFEFKAGDYADMKQRHGDHWYHFHHHNNLRVGTNPGPGIPPNVWINIFCTLFCARAGLIASWTTLANVMRWLLGAMNPNPKETLIWPSLQLILDTIKRCPADLWSSKREYTYSLIQPLEGFIQSTGDLFNTFRGIDVERQIIWQDRSAIFHLGTLFPSRTCLFQADLLIAQVIYSRMYRHDRGDCTEVIFYLDECDEYISRQAEAAYGENMSIISTGLKRGREYKLMFVLGPSHMGEVSRFVLNNAQYHLIHNLSDDLSVTEACRTLMLLQRGAGQILPGLNPGHCLYRESQGPWPHAMWAKMNSVPPCRLPMPTQYDNHPFIPGKRLHEMPHVYKALQQLLDQYNARKENGKAKKTKSSDQSQSLSNAAQKLLFAKTNHPWHPVARLWEKTKLTLGQTQKEEIYKQLEDLKLAEFEQVRISSRNQLLMDMTDAGWRHIGGHPPKHAGRGGRVHKYFSNWLKMVGEKRGFDSHLEWIVPGTSHPTDCAWQQPDGLWKVFEVCVTATDNLESHINSCFEQSNAVATLIIIVSQKKQAKSIEKQLKANPVVVPHLDRIQVETIEPYMLEATQ